jgi:hypothetical protein
MYVGRLGFDYGYYWYLTKVWVNCRDAMNSINTPGYARHNNLSLIKQARPYDIRLFLLFFFFFFQLVKLPASKTAVNRRRAWFCIIACIGNKTNQGMMRASEWLAEDLMQGIHLYAAHN